MMIPIEELGQSRDREESKMEEMSGDPGESQPLRIQTLRLPSPQMPSPPPNTDANTKKRTRKHQFTTTTIANTTVHPQKR